VSGTSVLLVGAIGCIFGAGLAILFGIVPNPRPAGPGESHMEAGGRSFWEKLNITPKSACAVLIPALAVALLTGWPVAALLAGAAGGFIPHLFGETSGSKAADKTEAIASWAEMLRDAMAASAGLGQAIGATSALAPLSIREHVTKLASRIDTGVPLGRALRQFAVEIDDPSADLVAAALILASEQRAQKLGDLLGALADASREEVTARLRIEASRAPVKTGVRVVSGFSIAFGALLMVMAHSYLAPFGSASGQLALLAVGAFYAGGLGLMIKMAKARTMPKLDFMAKGVAA